MIRRIFHLSSSNDTASLQSQFRRKDPPLRSFTAAAHYLSHTVGLCAILIAGPLGATGLASTGLLESSVQARLAFDSNPIGSGGTSTPFLSDADTLIYAASVTLTWTLPQRAARTISIKLNYTGEIIRFDRWSGEDYSTHRLSLNGQFAAGIWKYSGEASALYVAGSRDTFVSTSTLNANAIPLWRERREQWQHRMKLQTQASFGVLMVRGTASLIAYDYHTAVTLGKVAFANRSDAQAALDLGWTQSTDSLCFAGVRIGHQHQATVPLPNCEFDYTNHYYRLVTGWEGKPCANTTIIFSAGPDFHHYTGAIDERVFTGGRDRTSLWFEASVVTKLSSALTISGKATQFDWLASTGKSAYVDAMAETTAAWTLSPVWTLRLSAKAHRCDYFPAVRDDWERFYGAGATLKLSKNAALTLDVFNQNAWSHLSPVVGREFQRLYVSVGATMKL